jgi:hypothetical protein
MLGEEAIISKARYLSGKHGRRCDRHKREGECALPGEICNPAKASVVERRRDGFAEVSRGHSKRRPRREGPNVSEVIHVLSFDGAGDAELKAAKLEPMTEGRRRNLR